MSGELTYELFEDRSYGFRAAALVCAVAVVLLTLWMAVPAVLKYYASSVPTKQSFARDQQTVPTPAASDAQTTNIRVISVDRRATSVPASDRGDGDSVKQTSIPEPEISPSGEVTAHPTQTAVESNPSWTPFQPATQTSVPDVEVTPILRPPFPRPRPRVEAIIAASQIPLPHPRPQINSDESTSEPDVRSDRLSVLN
jgi:hypothetical protein